MKMVTHDDERFAWTEFYSEFADKLLQYRHDRGPLVEAITNVNDHPFKIEWDINMDTYGAVIDICPFTAMSAFTHSYPDDGERMKIAAEIAQFLGVSTPVPEFSRGNDGMPLLNPYSQCTHYAYEWEEEDQSTVDNDDDDDFIEDRETIDRMWQFFTDAIALVSDGRLLREFIDSYDRVRAIWGVGYNLTIGLFWIRPWDFLSLDRSSRRYITEEIGIRLPSSLPSGAKYLELRDLVKESFTKNGSAVHSFPQLSHAAHYSGFRLPRPSPLIPAPEPSQTYAMDTILADGCFLDEETLESMLHRLQTKQNIILQGPPGAGKTWLSKRLAYALIGHKDDDKVRQVQFHPNLSYEDFVRGYRPQGDGKLELVDGQFLKLAGAARQDPDGKYVMVIEEINRGNPASIFGELLTLLEADKRSPNDALVLAYPRDDDERFHVPPNVYVIGTMNLADRSLALVDFALRRRFAFFGLEPQLNDAWREWVQEECAIPEDFLANIAARISALNDQIAADRNLGPQFRIGHSHVTPPPDTPIDDPQQWFAEIVETEIAPLLREYWFDDTDRAEEESQKLLSGL